MASNFRLLSAFSSARRASSVTVRNEAVRRITYSQSMSAKAKAKDSKSKDTSSRAQAPSPESTMSREVCTGANYFTDGSDPTLKEDSHYPAWLWELLPGKDTDSDPKLLQRRERKKLARSNNAARALLG